MNGVFSVIGKRLPRPDALPKARGRAVYAGDIHYPGMLHAKALRSPYPYARIERIDSSAALRHPGVRAVLTIADVPGERLHGVMTQDWPVLADGVARYVGEAVAVVVAIDEEVATEALDLVRVEYTPLKPVLTVEEALAPGAPQLHPGGNLVSTRIVQRGDLRAGFAAAAAIVETTYETTIIEHAYIEPEVGVARLEPDGTLLVIAGCQHVHHVAHELHRITRLPPDKIRVIEPATGGAFGGKGDIGVECTLALAALKTGQPVRMTYTREESFLASTKRHPIRFHFRTGADRDGHLTAQQILITSDGGAYASSSGTVATRTSVFGCGPYECPNLYAESRFVYTNNPVGGAMRGFGVPQLAVGWEGQMDLLAAELGLDPVEIRLRNAYREGSLSSTGQRLTNVALPETIKLAGEIYHREKRLLALRPPFPHVRFGVGIGCLWYGVGNTSRANPAWANTKVKSEGKLVLYTGAVDIGQGSESILQQIAAEAFGCAYADVEVIQGDSLLTKDAGKTSASRITFIAGNAVARAARETRRQLLEELSKRMQRTTAALDLREGMLYVDGQPAMPLARAMEYLNPDMEFLAEGYFNPETSELDDATGQGVPYQEYVYGTQVALVEVDTETGQVHVPECWAVHDVGMPINPINVEGQIEGGIGQGVGFAVTEEYKVKDGVPQTTSLMTYLLPTAPDSPKVTPTIVDNYCSTGPFGAKAVGEAPLIPTAAAILNAIADATGVRITRLPASPENVCAALRARR